jgi:LPS sulfotransferase NodH
MKPNLSYTIWFSQRTGSTLLCKALEATGVAGLPNEWFNCQPDLLKDFKLPNHAELEKYLWEAGSTPNKIFGNKHSFYEPHFSKLIETLRQFPSCPPHETNRARIWEYVFPHHRHIFMTRRNKVRLAVSWWQAIKSDEWHRLPNESKKQIDLSDAYSFDAINHLYNECSMREAGIQEFFTEGNITPLTIVYEDFIQGYEQTIRTVLDYLHLNADSINITPPPLSPTADSVSEEWVQHFRLESQNGWTNKGW